MQKIDKAFLIRQKVYVDRARMYIGYAQFLMILMVFLKSFNIKLFEHHQILSGAISFIIFIICSLIVGKIDFKLGFFSEELKRHTETNPVMIDVIERLERIEKEVKKENEHLDH